MLMFQLQYSLLYAHMLHQFKQGNLQVELNKLNSIDATYFLQRLQDCNLLQALVTSNEILGFDVKLTQALATELLCWELNLMSSVLNCYLQSSVLVYQTTSEIQRLTLPEDLVNKIAVNNLLIAHGIRWGWKLIEYPGEYFLLKADRDYTIDRWGCSCQVVNCQHQQFAFSLIKDRTKFSLAISQISCKLS